MDALAAAGLLGLASSTEVGGAGHGMRVVAEVIERLAAECGSTAMVVLMHYAATAVIEAQGPHDVRAAIATGDHLTTWRSPSTARAATSGRRPAPRRPPTTTPSASTPVRAGSPRPARPTATSGRAFR
ncbi:acyl-CoA dehydrogenase family protein [Micromonospora sp. H61]|nr:acyl-CoA dehydrogenase family protein [Micromonospora sp. H61]